VALGTVCDLDKSLLAVSTPDLVRLMVVAAVTGIANIVGWMADQAGDVPLLAVVQRKSVIPKTRRQPALHSVAGRAVRAKLPEMDLRLLMARSAPTGERQKCLHPMTPAARDTRMRAIERQDGPMIKGLRQSSPIVTRQAGVAITVDVARQKHGVDLPVAVGTCCLVEAMTGSVTIATSEIRPVRLALVTDCREPHPVVRETAQCCLRDIRFTPSVLGVARGARLGIVQPPMESRPPLDLVIDGRVARQAPRRIHAVPGVMAEQASRRHVGVTGVPLQKGVAAACRQRARAEQRRTTQEHRYPDHDHRDQGGDQSIDRQAAQVCLHPFQPQVKYRAAMM
jgi:hypothetical protein